MSKYININVRKFVAKEISSLRNRFSILAKEQRRALKLAYRELRARLKRMNEIREQLREQANTFVSKDEYNGDKRLINTKIEHLSRLVYVGLGIWIVFQAILSAILIIIFKH